MITKDLINVKCALHINIYEIFRNYEGLPESEAINPAKGRAKGGHSRGSPTEGRGLSAIRKYYLFFAS